MADDNSTFTEMFEARSEPRVAAIRQQVRLKNGEQAEPVEFELHDLLLMKKIACALGFWSEVDESGDLLGSLRTFRAAQSPISRGQLQVVIALAERALNATQPPTCIEFAQAVGKAILIQKYSHLGPLRSIEHNGNWWESKHE